MWVTDTCEFEAVIAFPVMQMMITVYVSPPRLRIISYSFSDRSTTTAFPISQLMGNTHIVLSKGLNDSSK